MRLTPPTPIDKSMWILRLDPAELSQSVPEDIGACLRV